MPALEVLPVLQIFVISSVFAHHYSGICILLELFTYGIIYLCQLGRHLPLSYLKRGYKSTTLTKWIVTLKPIELEPGKTFFLTVVQEGDLIVVNVFIYLFYCYLFFIHFSNYLGVASLGPRVRSRAPSPFHIFL